MSTHDIFISYKSEEYDDAMWVKERLESEGITCWMAPQSIPGGSSYAAEIPPAIRGCRVFVLVLSAKTQESKWVPRELDQAINASKVIMPFMIEKCELRSDFSFYLTNVQWYEAYKHRDRAMEWMLRDLHKMLAPFKEAERPAVSDVLPANNTPQAAQTESPQAATQKTPSDERLKAIKWTVIAAWVVIAAAVVGFLLIPALTDNGTSLFTPTVTIAGQTFSNSDSTVELNAVIVTAEDVEAIGAMPEVSTVRMTDCVLQTDDLSAIVHEGLYRLELTRCGLTDAQLATLDFSKAPSVYDLRLGGNTALTDLSPLAVLAENLTYLELADVPLADPTQLAVLKKLTVLNVDRTGLADLSPLTEMLYLEEVSARGNALTSLVGMDNITRLKTADLRDNALISVEPLKKSAQTMRELYLSGNRLVDTAFVSGMTELRVLALDRNLLTSLDGLDSCASLQMLSLSHNGLTQLAQEALPDDGTLTYLDVSHNALESVALMAAAFGESSVVVDVSHNRLQTLELPEETSFRAAAMHGNEGLRVQALDTLRCYYVFLPWSDEADTASLQKASPLKVHLTGCPLDQRVATEDTLYGVIFCTDEEADSAFEEYRPAWVTEE